MTTEIQQADASVPQLPQVANRFEADFGTFTSGLYLPRLQLEGSNSTAVKKRQIAAGHYALITGKDQMEDLGEAFDCLALTYRYKAMDLRDKKAIIASFDKNSTKFKTIVAQAATVRKGLLYGLEFLLYIPSARSEQKFATFFMGNPTMRVAAKNFGPILDSAKRKNTIALATLKCEMVSNPEHTWEAPIILPCSSKIAEYPTHEEMREQMELFLDPKEDAEVELASEDEQEATSGSERPR